MLVTGSCSSLSRSHDFALNQFSTHSLSTFEKDTCAKTLLSRTPGPQSALHEHLLSDWDWTPTNLFPLAEFSVLRPKTEDLVALSPYEWQKIIWAARKNQAHFPRTGDYNSQKALRCSLVSLSVYSTARSPPPQELPGCVGGATFFLFNKSFRQQRGGEIIQWASGQRHQWAGVLLWELTWGPGSLRRLAEHGGTSLLSCLSEASGSPWPLWNPASMSPVDTASRNLQAHGH